MNLKLGIIQVSNFHENLTMLKVKLGFITTQLKSGCYFDSECAPRTPSVASHTAAALRDTSRGPGLSV